MQDITSKSYQQAVASIMGLADMGFQPEVVRKASKSFVRVDSKILEDAAALDPGDNTLAKAITRRLNAGNDVERLAFESDPTANNKYGSLYRQKTRLIPDKLLKRIAIQDELVACIVQARQNQMAAFGRPRPDRFSNGFVIELRQEANEAIEQIQDQSEKQKRKRDYQTKIAAVTKRLMSCGDPIMDLSGNQGKLTFPQYISMSIRNAVVVGRLATEVVRHQDEAKTFAGIRVVDAGTIYRALPQQSAAEAVRRQAIHLLENLRSERLDPDRYLRDEYAWVQVIDDRPVQAFAADELLVHNFYPVPDVELDGYPVTPLDTVIQAVTTHINIGVHNKLYFQSGRAARGMLVLQSDDADEQTISRIRQVFNAQINSVNNAWRMPVFAVGQEDKISWQPIDNSSRDMEFQYLADMNARIILSAFLMSPEELPGWAYLSRGTNNQALSEGNNEYKLEAARDVGIRPLLAQFEDFLNQSILPLFDPELARDCVLKLVGLDAETQEKESVRIQQDMPVHMTYDEVLQKVEKKAVGKALGGEFPLNPQYQAVLDKYVPVGQILESFFGVKGAAKNPQWAYVRDPFWFQFMQMQQQAQMAQQQAQAQAQQAQQGGGGQGDGGGEQGPPQDQTQQGEAAKPDREQVQTEAEKSQAAQEQSASPDLSRAIDQALGSLSKAEKLSPGRKRLVQRQRQLLGDIIKTWDQEAAAAAREIARSIKPPKAKA